MALTAVMTYWCEVKGISVLMKTFVTMLAVYSFTGLNVFTVPLRHVLLSSSSFVAVGSETDCDGALCVPDLRPAVNTQCKKIFFLSRPWGLIIFWEVENNLAATLRGFFFNAHANSEDLTLKNPEILHRKEETTPCFLNKCPSSRGSLLPYIISGLFVRYHNLSDFFVFTWYDPADSSLNKINIFFQATFTLIYNISQWNTLQTRWKAAETQQCHLWLTPARAESERKLPAVEV